MENDEFARSFHDCSLSKLSHEDHLRLAWLVLSKHDLEKAHYYVSSGLKQFARSKGSEGAYHETITGFWLYLVDHCIRSKNSKVENFEEFLRENPFLLDKGLMFRHWRKETILSSDARSRWIEPDVSPLTPTA